MNKLTQLPKGWEICNLEDYIKLIDYRGRTPVKTEKGIRLITAKNVKLGYLQLEPQEFINPTSYNSWMTRGIPNYGDVIFTTEAPLANVAQLNTTEKVAFAQRIIVMQPQLNKINQAFLKYLLLSDSVRGKILDNGTGATVQGIKASLLKKIQLPLPPLPEQQRIVAILDEAFASISKAKANAEQNLKNVKELFDSYLASVFTNRGEGWEVKRLEEVCEFKSGTTIPTSLERTDGDVLYTKVADMNLPENQIEMNTSSRFVNINEIKQNQIIPHGSIIFPKRGGAIATNKKRKIVKPTIVDLNTMAITPGKKIDKDFLFFWFQRIDLTEISNGTSIPQINNYSFDAVCISYPITLTEQQSVVQKLDALSAETKKLEAIYQNKLNDLEELKKSILQKAFNGEL